MSDRQKSSIYCPACARQRPISQMTVQVSRYERQILTECKTCQTRARVNHQAQCSAWAAQRKGGAL